MFKIGFTMRQNTFYINVAPYSSWYNIHLVDILFACLIHCHIPYMPFRLQFSVFRLPETSEPTKITSCVGLYKTKRNNCIVCVQEVRIYLMAVNNCRAFFITTHRIKYTDSYTNAVIKTAINIS
jgi:hypothetical protein